MGGATRSRRRRTRIALVAAVAVAALGAVIPTAAIAEEGGLAPAEIAVEGTLLVIPPEAEAMVSDSGGSAPEPVIHFPGTVSIVTDGGETVELMQGEHADYASGGAAEATFAVPEAVQSEVEPLLEPAMNTSEIADLVVETARELDEPLALLSHDISPGTAAAGVAPDPDAAAAAVSRAHVIDVMILRSTAAEPAPAAAATTAWAQRLSDYWRTESGGQVSQVTIGAVRTEAMPTEAILPNRCSNTQGLWNWAATKFGRSSYLNYLNQSAPRHLIVLQSAEACGDRAGTGLGTVGGTVHTGGATWQTVELAKPLEWDHVSFHEFGHNISLMHSNSLWCDAGHYDSARLAPAFDVSNPGATIWQPDNASCSVREYYDIADVMGYGWIQTAPSGTAFNNFHDVESLTTTHRLELGALPSAAIGRLNKHGGGTQVVDLKPSTDASGLRAIVVTDPATGQEYVLEYRAGQGRDANSMYAKWQTNMQGTSLELGRGVRVLRAPGSNYSVVQYRPALAAEAGQQTVPHRGAPAGAYPYLAQGASFKSFSDGLGVRVLTLSNTNARVEITFPNAGQLIVLPAGQRIAGADRFETAVEVSNHAYPSATGGTVIVATGLDYPDSLSAAPLGAKLQAPLLLTAPTSLPDATREEILRLKPSRILVIGGTGAVSAGVEADLKQLPPSATVERVFGADRYETSVAIARKGWTASSDVFVATGAGFADALSAGSAAGSLGAPVVLVPGTQSGAPAAVSKLLNDLGARTIYISGGTGAVSTEIAASLTRSRVSERFAGSDRFDTSARIADRFHTAGGSVYLANGFGFADALTGAAVAGSKKAPLMLSTPVCVPNTIRDAQERVRPTRIYLLGGIGVLSERVETSSLC